MRVVGALGGGVGVEQFADGGDDVSRVRAAALRKRCLSLAKTCSIGFRSGEYLGRKNSFAPAERMAWRTASPLWLPRLSMITTSPGLSVGASAFST